MRRAVLSAQFQADHGRPPTPKEAIALAQQANLETRQAKHEPRSYAEQRAAWRAEALAVLGGETAAARLPPRALRGAVGRTPAGEAHRRRARAWVERDRRRRSLTVVQSAAARRGRPITSAPRPNGTPAPPVFVCGDLDRAVDAVVAAALTPARSLPLGNRDADAVRGQ